MPGDIIADNIDTMFTSEPGPPPDADEPEEVLQYLTESIKAVRDALDDGVSLADTLFSAQGLDFDPYLWAHIVRCRADQALRKLSPVDTWQPGQKLPNSGIELLRGPFRLRTLKRQDDGPPSPGRNKRRRGYWSQYHQPVLTGWREVQGISFIGANLILDWAVEDDRSLVLALSKPVGIWRYKGIPQLAWRRPITIEAGKDELRFQPSDEEDGLDVGYEPDEFWTDEQDSGDGAS